MSLARDCFINKFLRSLYLYQSFAILDFEVSEYAASLCFFYSSSSLSIHGNRFFLSVSYRYMHTQIGPDYDRLDFG